jgi:hypothetical protein
MCRDRETKYKVHRSSEEKYEKESRERVAPDKSGVHMGKYRSAGGFCHRTQHALVEMSMDDDASTEH